MGQISSGVYPCYENEFMVGATKETATTISEMETCSVSIDNGVETWNPFTSQGWQSALQTSKAITISISGKRDNGDTGNDYVAGKTFANGQQAYGYFCWNLPDGTCVEWNKAVYNVTNAGTGDSTAVATLEFEVVSNGKPNITTQSSGISGASVSSKSNTSS